MFFQKKSHKNEENVNSTRHWYFPSVFKGSRALFFFLRGGRREIFCIYCTKFTAGWYHSLEGGFTYFFEGMLYNADVEWVGRQAP